MQIPVFTSSPYIPCQQMSTFQSVRTSEKYFSKSVHAPSAVSRVPVPVKAASSCWASLVGVMHLCTSQKQPGVLDSSTCKGERNKPVSLSLSCLKRCRMDAIWRSHSLRSGSPPGKLGLFPAPPIVISKSVNILQPRRHRWAPICRLLKFSKSSRPTRWCRCRQRWWLPSWEWSQWCPTWPRCSPPYPPCLGFPFPHHCGECLPFSLEKSAVFVSDQSGMSR